ncbi:hypothetical protein AYM40_26015 [Paraburkholderia phytofirmans OLGA172]|uniref:Uncharacterized protein n=1 Tax=Paraburkholderia phytofirmans OLGA172 TaxID=1417228 RepID=A0A160FRV7_9BURK|nr:hypothetical protein AYM40_26015 [Paraburkholderia phytofirmans OLGA172]
MEVRLLSVKFNDAGGQDMNAKSLRRSNPDGSVHHGGLAHMFLERTQQGILHAFRVRDQRLPGVGEIKAVASPIKQH